MSAENNYYFGEMTFYPSGRLAPIYPEEWDEIIGDWICINNSKNRVQF